MAPQLAVIAPRPQSTTTEPAQKIRILETHHSAKEWEAVYPHIERLYVQQRQKLRHVMDIMKEKHNFKATVQMYKKHLTKWGLTKKRNRCSHATVKVVSPASSSDFSCYKDVTTKAPISPMRLSDSDSVYLALLTSIHDWSSAFFESDGAKDHHAQISATGILSSTNSTGRYYDGEELSFTFRIVDELLRRGQGQLAGQLTRKAFLQIETMLHVEAPVFIWNLLEIMHHMAKSAHGQLFRLLLLHLNNLAKQLFAETSPVTRLLQAIWKLGLLWDDEQHTSAWQTSVIDRAWTMNSDIICDNFDPRLMLMYYSFVWDSDCVSLSQQKLKKMDQWVRVVTDKTPVSDSLAYDPKYLDRIHPDLFQASPMNSTLVPPPEEYDFVKQSSILAIQHRSTLEFDSLKVRLRVLSALMKSRLFEDDGGLTTTSLDTDVDGTPSPPFGPVTMSKQHQTPLWIARLHARIIAFITNVLIEVDSELGSGIDVILERTRNVIALREFGQSPTAPQVIHQMWQLEELLLQQGDTEEAARIRQETYERLERCVELIPE